MLVGVPGRLFASPRVAREGREARADITSVAFNGNI